MKIKLCCDFLMTRSVTQEYHLRWFESLLRFSIGNAVHAQVDRFVSSDTGLSCNEFSREKFFALSNLLVDLNSTHAYFNPKQITKGSLNYLSEFLTDSLVIGYELSEETRELLKQINVPYIDIWLHPIRFLDDNFYAYNSSIKSIREKLDKYHVSESLYYLYATKLKISSYMGWNKCSDRNLKDDSCLFVGQTLTDKAVCKKGKMLTVLDFKQEFTELCKRFSHVYYSQHPMFRGDFSEQEAWLKQFPNVSFIKEPSYKLICSDKIKKVVAISSSLVYEAKFFGKEISYLYRPVVPISEVTSDEKYRSIFNKLHSSDFWQDILSEYFLPKSNESVDFLSQNNTYRDMLSLFYNNGYFDKNQWSFDSIKSLPLSKEAVKPTLKTVPPKVEKVRGYYSNQKSVEDIKKRILEKEIISFDIFDTLVQRNVLNPGDVLTIVAQYVANKYKINENSFLDIRRTVKKFFPNAQEVPLLDRYKKICEVLNIPAQDARDLCSYEEQVDLKLLRPREVGLQLLNFARSNKKKVIVTSDTYYSRDFIQKLLNSFSISVDELFLSSEHNLTKESGDLFKTVKSILGSSSILHIGDNERSDYVNPKTKGLIPYLLFSNKQQIRNTLSYYKDLRGDYSAIRNGLIINKLAQFPVITSNPGYTAGKAEIFGYSVVGDIFLSFSHWILNEARKKGIKKLFFLARDGEIVKKVFDKINNSKTGIKTEYLLASRRAVRVASLYTKEDVIKEVDDLIKNLKMPVDSSSLWVFLSLRCGLPETQLKTLFKEKLPEISVEGICTESFIHAVLLNSKKERELYIQYLESKGVGNGAAFVDIGHNGSLQAAIAKLLRLKNSLGLYFATYSKIRDVLSSITGSHTAFGFYRNEFDVNNRSDNYIIYALMIETLFLNNRGTFLGFESNEKEHSLVPKYLPTSNEAKRVSFVRKMDTGILQYVQDVVETLKDLNIDFINNDSFSQSYDPCERFFIIMKTPTYRDALMFSGVTLENYFSGRQLRYIVPEVGVQGGVSLWREGTKALERGNSSVNNKNITSRPSINASEKKMSQENFDVRKGFSSGVATIILKILEFFSFPFMDERRKRKLKLTREKFYIDSKNKFVRKLYEKSRSGK